MTGQLKVSLRPLWSPTATAIASLSKQFPDVVWGLAFRELQQLAEPAMEAVSPDWLQSTTSEAEEIKESERSWRDPSAFKLRCSVRLWCVDSSCADAVIEVRCAVYVVFVEVSQCSL